MYFSRLKLKHHLNRKNLVLVGFIFLIICTFGVIGTGSNASAATGDKYNPLQKAKSFTYANATYWCIQHGGGLTANNTNAQSNDQISQQNAAIGNWWLHEKSGVKERHAYTSSYILGTTDSNGQATCNDIKTAGGNLWGYTTSNIWLCKITANRVKDGSACMDSSGKYIANTNSEFDNPDTARDGVNGRDRFWATLKSDVYDNKEPPALTESHESDWPSFYLLYRAAFLSKQGCAAREVNLAPGEGDGNFIYRIGVVEGKDVVDKVYQSEVNRGTVKSVYIENRGGGTHNKNCGEIADAMNKYAESYKNWLKSNNTTDDGVVSTGGGFNDNVTGSDSDEDSTSCAIDGVGWIVCPITNFLAGVSDASFDVITNFLQVDVQLLNTDSGTYSAWTSFRNIANVAFVIVFIIIIYSQLTGMGVSNYGVKKTLPRLVIAAILVNVSFFICQLAVDVTQILGGSVVDLFKAIPIGAEDQPVPTWTAVMGDVLAGSGVLLTGIAAGAVGIAIVALSISGPVMLAVLLAVLLTVIILIGRQAAIVILIVLSPLAFVAFMLPNTEQWFKKWYKAFLALLMVFPIIALLYGGGQLTSRILSSVSSNSNDGAQFWLSITAIAVAALPLIMTPSLLKSSLNGIGSIGGKLSTMAGKANSNVRKSASTSSRYGEAKQGLKNRFALGRATRRSSSSIQRGIDQSRFGRALGLDKGTARALGALDEEENKEVSAAVAQITHDTTSVNRVDESARILKEAIISGDKTKARAAQRVLLSSGSPGLATLQSIYEGKHEGKGTPAQMAEAKALSSAALSAIGNENRGELVGSLRSEINSSGLKGKNNALARWGYDGGIRADQISKLTDPTAAESPSTFTKLNSVELAGQSVENLRLGATHISAEAAQAALSNPEAAAFLDDDKRLELKKIIAAKSVTPGVNTHTVINAGSQNEALIPRSATEIRTDINSTGGVAALSDAELLRIHHNTVDTISKADPGRATLKTDTEAEIASRGIIYDKKAMRK